MQEIHVTHLIYFISYINRIGYSYGGNYNYDKILVVDDEERIRRLLKLYLERESFDIEEAQDGKEALDMALNTDYACILLDLMLPELDGIEVANRLREYKDTPIIMLTAKVKKQIV